MAFLGRPDPHTVSPHFGRGEKKRARPRLLIAHAAIFPISVFLCHVIRFLPSFEHGPFYKLILFYFYAYLQVV